MKQRIVASLALSLAFSFACGNSDDDGQQVDGDGAPIVDADPFAPDADPNAADADPNAPDAAPGACTPGASECNNCIDDDGDGLADGLDPECTGIDDNDEGSFATDIPGDNIDGTKQDCFFDGNSGAGDDGCDMHVCCLLPEGTCCEAGETNEVDGCYEYSGPTYDPNSCGQTQACTDACQPLTPAGCDCFGCCTVCNGNDCVDVLTNPAVYENENCVGITDPAQGECCESEPESIGGCFTCVKSTDCSGANCDDDPNDCILCPGQSEADLPESCNEQTCPDNQTVCQLTEDCGENEYCSGGCCVGAIIID